MPNSRPQPLGRKPKVFVTRKLPDAIETRMMELFDVQLNLSDVALSRDEIAAAMADVDVLVPTVTDRIDAGLIEGAGDKLRLIASFGTGVDHIDLRAAKARGITITNTPGVLTEDTADMTMALIPVPRRIVEGQNEPKAVLTGWSPMECWVTAFTASGLGSSVWAGSERRSHGAPGALACRCTTTIASVFIRTWKKSWRPFTGTIWIR